MSSLPQPAEMPEAPTTPELRHAMRSDWHNVSWPINEILLESLVLQGRKDSEIATLCGVQAEDVRSLRKAYGL